MLSRTAGLSTLLAAALVSTGSAQQTYAPNFGVSAPLIATGNSITATYYGWEATTVYGHAIYALTGSEYATDLANGCFNFSAEYRTSCDGSSNSDLAGLLGIQVFGTTSGGGKPYGVTCVDASLACFGTPFVHTFDWADGAGSEVIFALQVNQDNSEYNWFFSGDPSRNFNPDPPPSGSDGFAHLAYWSDGVAGNKGAGIVPGTAGLALFGFEDVTYKNSDWDFDNAIFGVSGNSIDIPPQITPEPATMTLLAGGLAGLSALGVRRRARRPTRDA